MTPPTISISTDFESGLHHLIAESYGYSAAAGPRLFRREPFPQIKFQHDDLDLAQADAKTLQDYINETWSGKTQKSAAQKIGIWGGEGAPTAVPVWEIFKDEQTNVATGDEW